jgi:hypothetical protein
VLPGDRDLLQKRADGDRSTFQRLWGFTVGSPEYYAAFRSTRENVYERSGRLDGSAAEDR